MGTCSENCIAPGQQPPSQLFDINMLITLILVLSLCNYSRAEIPEKIENSRAAKLFFVSSSSTTSTLSTTTACFISNTAAALAACGKRRRRALQTALGDFNIKSSPVDSINEDDKELELESGVKNKSNDRDGRFLLYWMTTTSTSTSTSYPSTSTLASLECTPSGFAINLCG